jgi:hypothetical protein
MRPKGLRNRNGLLGGRIARPQSQIDDNIFDHDVNLLERLRPIVL